MKSNRLQTMVGNWGGGTNKIENRQFHGREKDRIIDIILNSRGFGIW